MYKIGEERDEKSICVVATGDSPSIASTKDFFKAMSLQNYTNFKIFFVDDHFEDDFSLRAFALVSN